MVLVCGSTGLALHGNTFESLVSDAYARGSGVSSSSNCPVDATGNFWDSNDPDLVNTDGKDKLGWKLVDASNPLDVPAIDTPTMEPGWPGRQESLGYNINAAGVVQLWWPEPPTGGLPVTYTVDVVEAGSDSPTQTRRGPVERGHVTWPRPGQDLPLQGDGAQRRGRHLGVGSIQLAAGDRSRRPAERPI